MAISDAQFTTWLSSNLATRNILVEVNVKSGSEITRYLSTQSYFDSVATRHYEPILAGDSIQTVERLAIDGSGSANIGDIEMLNLDGSRDSWLTSDVWAKRDIAAYIGDVTWDRSDYRPIFIGVTDDIDSRSADVLNIKMRDKLDRLDVAVTESKLGGTTPNKNELIPICFGECHNISPLLSNPSTLEYRVNDGNVERIIEVRSNGVPAGISEELGSGKFWPSVNPQGTKITASVQGVNGGNGYITGAFRIIEHLAWVYGEPTNQFRAPDFDYTNLFAFDAANPQILGIYISKRENLKNICEEIANSVGAQISMSRAGKLQLHKIDLPPPGTPVEVTEADMVQGSLFIKERIPVVGTVTIGYNKNWSIQDPLDTGIPQDHKDLFAKEWLTVSAEDAGTKSDYRTDPDPEQIDTFLQVEADASAEATRRLNLFKTQRHIYSFTGTARFVELQLGDSVTITHPRFGLSGGLTGMVVGLSVNWGTMLTEIEIFA